MTGPIRAPLWTAPCSFSRKSRLPVLGSGIFRCALQAVAQVLLQLWTDPELQGNPDAVTEKLTPMGGGEIVTDPMAKDFETVVQVWLGITLESYESAMAAIDPADFSP